MTTLDELAPATNYAIEPATTPFVETLPIHGLRLRDEATPEEVQTYNAMENQRLAVLAEQFIMAIAQMSSCDLHRITQAIGFQAMLNAQEQQADAQSALTPDFLQRFIVFSNAVLEQFTSDLRGLQSLADANIREIVVNLPYFRHLPPERQNFVRMFFGLFKG